MQNKDQTRNAPEPSTARHFPGPWKITPARPGFAEAADILQDLDQSAFYTSPLVIASIRLYGEDPERLANAALLVAAPDLLEVATELLGQLAALAAQVKAAGLLIPPNVTKAIDHARRVL